MKRVKVCVAAIALAAAVMCPAMSSQAATSCATINQCNQLSINKSCITNKNANCSQVKGVSVKKNCVTKNKCNTKKVLQKKCATSPIVKQCAPKLCK